MSRSSASQQEHCSLFAFPRDEELFLVSCLIKISAHLHEGHMRAQNMIVIHSVILMQTQQCCDEDVRFCQLSVISGSSSCAVIGSQTLTSPAASADPHRSYQNTEALLISAFRSVKMNSRSQECVEALKYLSKEEAVAMETELLRDYHFGRQQLTEILGNACATAITKVFPLWTLEKRQPTVLVVCGPDQNGCVGLACARHLRVFEYIPTVFTPKRSSDSLHQDLMVQCERMDLPFLSYLPTEVQLINEAYNLVVDAVLGPETEAASVGEPFTGVLQTLRGLKVPIVSLDIPSGWDADESSSDGISPALLVSLMAPKRCALSFPGSHFLAGRFLPFDLQRKYKLNLPKFSGTDSVVQL